MISHYYLKSLITKRLKMMESCIWFREPCFCNEPMVMGFGILCGISEPDDCDFYENKDKDLYGLRKLFQTDEKECGCISIFNNNKKEKHNKEKEVKEEDLVSIEIIK